MPRNANSVFLLYANCPGWRKHVHVNSLNNNFPYQTTNQQYFKVYNCFAGNKVKKSQNLFSFFVAINCIKYCNNKTHIKQQTVNRILF